MFLTFIYIAECINTYKCSVFVSVLSSIPWYVYTKFVFPLTNQYLDCFQLLTIINNATINTCESVCVDIFSFLSGKYLGVRVCCHVGLPSGMLINV